MGANVHWFSKIFVVWWRPQNITLLKIQKYCVFCLNAAGPLHAQTGTKDAVALLQLMALDEDMP
jgi:hypothetical protein